MTREGLGSDVGRGSPAGQWCLSKPRQTRPRASPVPPRVTGLGRAGWSQISQICFEECTPGSQVMSSLSPRLGPPLLHLSQVSLEAKGTPCPPLPGAGRDSPPSALSPAWNLGATKSPAKCGQDAGAQWRKSGPVVGLEGESAVPAALNPRLAGGVSPRGPVTQKAAEGFQDSPGKALCFLPRSLRTCRTKLGF